MIPKKIHYCWFGGKPLPEITQKCIQSWKKYCPDYEIIQWNESNFDLDYNIYVKEAYQAKKWAFVSDVARLQVLVEHGGVYLDTDMEVLKPLDEILKCESLTGFESDAQIATGILACEKGNVMMTELLHCYDDIHFKKEDGSLDLTTIVERLTKVCLRHGLELNNSLQVVNGLTVYPKDYFYPKSIVTGELIMTENTCAIHHYDGSWLPFKKRVGKKLAEIFGYEFVRKLSKIKRKFARK